MVVEPQFDELYRELILDHYRRPRNNGALESPNRHAEGVNPVCGDEITIDMVVDDDTVQEIAFRGIGCSISQSSASMMTERVKGRPPAEALRVGAHFKAMLNGAAPDPDLGDLEALQGVAQFPVRVKCALLCWKVLEEGLQQPPITTGGLA